MFCGQMPSMCMHIHMRVPCYGAFDSPPARPFPARGLEKTQLVSRTAKSGHKTLSMPMREIVYRARAAEFCSLPRGTLNSAAVSAADTTATTATTTTSADHASRLQRQKALVDLCSTLCSIERESHAPVRRRGISLPIFSFD